MPSLKSKSVALLGATGMVGGQLLTLLEGEVSIRKIVLLGRSFPESEHPKVVKVKADFQDAEFLTETLKGIDVIFCCIGTTIKVAGSEEAFRKVDYSIPVAVANAGVEAGVKKFLCISSLGADFNSRNFYLKTKGEMERDIVSLPYQKVALVRPSLLLGHRKEFRLGERIAQFFMVLFSFLMLGSLKKYRPIRDVNVAKAMLMITNSANNQKVYESNELAWLGK
jgi:uncharacterized protein YbjT (DUF2867 family)